MTNKQPNVKIASDFITAVRDHGIRLFEFRAGLPKFSVGDILLVRETWRFGIYGNVELKADCSPDDVDGWRYAHTMPLRYAKRVARVKSIRKITPEEFSKTFDHSWKYGSTSFGCPKSDLPDKLWFRKGERIDKLEKSMYAVEYDLRFAPQA